MRQVGDRIGELRDELRAVEPHLESLLLNLPNLPDASTPEGLTEDQNVVVRSWGEPRKFSFQAKPHWALGPALGILDFEAAAKISGANFEVMRGPGARLRRALIDFMLDLHTRDDRYTEVALPVIARRDSLLASGHLPFYEEDQFKLVEQDFYLIPTAEAALANLHRDEILEASRLPRCYVAHTPCFRNEKFSGGKETRGLIRQYQFDKVELFKLVRPETSFEELEKLVADAERVYQLLELPYRLELLCAGEISKAAAKAYDPVAWFPGMEKWLELSSCSNCLDWQARRANIRFRPAPKAKPEFVHTLNGSGLAVGRTLACVIENYQEADGSIRVPDVLVDYMNGLTRIEPL